MALTSDQLIEKVVLAAFWPSTEANRPRTNAQILSLADDVILGEVMPRVTSAHADYYICTLDHELQPTYSRYRAPQELYGPIRDVLYVDSAGDEFDLKLIDLEDLGRRDNLGNSPRYHFIDGDYVGVYPTPAAGETGTLRIRYFHTPSQLQLAATCTTITAVDLETDPLAFTVADASLFDDGDESTPGDSIDIISQGNAHMLLAEDSEIADISGSVITVAATLLGSGIQVGDHVCPANTTPIVQVPDHLVPWLVQMVAARCMARHDDSGSAQCMQKANELWAAAHPVTAPRTESSQQAWVDVNSPYRLG